ncbi:universal stress protein [Microlunatus panaciterrae]|uniref:Nucleotide-binding universal stress UspA family protein n=1 Tax=Microlunatus panaciterrae TaxID=400768 RepID=A0ABS2RGL3_9ACTN|nr:universal stress protein [Microlunatus panaciterrae]MBM7797677.1 nucleotide-binding universal stress UspA family protein [Microlunatus panaciterrae]
MSIGSASGKIVVGVDDSTEALTAARYAVHEAELRKTDLELMHAYQVPEVVEPISEDYRTRVMRGPAVEVMRQVMEQLVIPPGVTVQSSLHMTEPVIMLVEASDRAQLIVLGQHHITLGERLLEGSVASPVAARANCPVVIVPRVWDPEPEKYGPVVVALDGDTPAETALSYAFDEAEARGSQLVALHAVPLGTMPGELSLQRLNIEEVLAGWKQDHPDIRVKTFLTTGDPDLSIIEASRQAAVLIVGRPHRDTFGAWTRSVARSVLKETHCPLVVVPATPVSEVTEGTVASSLSG